MKKAERGRAGRDFCSGAGQRRWEMSGNLREDEERRG